MRRNRRRPTFNLEAETKRMVYISVATIILAIITFIITYAVYSNVLSKRTMESELSKITELSSNKSENVTETSSSIGKSVNEIQNEIEDNNDKENNENTTTEKIAINTSKIESTSIVNNKKDDDAIIKEEINETKKETKQTNANVVETPDPTFIKPVEGEIIREFARDNLVYSETLKEWITHNGIDIKADKTTVVKAASGGTIKAIKNDPRYGITVIIEHQNGFVSVYSNLLTAEFVKEKEEVRQGQTIGTVGDTASFEILDDSHLHFELLKNNEYLNPSDYIK